MLRATIIGLAASGADAFMLSPSAGFRADSQSSAVSMMAKGVPIPKGPFGNYRMPGEDVDEVGWVGDRSRGTQIANFEAGEDYLFFQGPAPSTAIQEDLPSFFSGENFADLQISGTALAVTGLGFGSAAVLASVLLGPLDTSTLSLPSAPSVSAPAASAPAPKVMKAEKQAKVSATKAKAEAKKAEIAAKISAAAKK